MTLQGTFYAFFVLPDVIELTLRVAAAQVV